MSGYAVHNRASLVRNPRARRAWLEGLLAHAQQTGDFEALRAARDALSTIGEDSQNSARRRFEARYANVAGEFTLRALEDKATATIVSLGQRVLNAPYVLTRTSVKEYAGYSRMRQSIETLRTLFVCGTIVQGEIAHNTLLRSPGGALVTPTTHQPSLIVAAYKAGRPIRGIQVPLASQPSANGDEMIEHTDIRLDPVTVRLMSDGVRAEGAEIAQHIMDSTAPSRYLAPLLRSMFSSPFTLTTPAYI